MLSIYDLIYGTGEGSNYATLMMGLYYGNSVSGLTLENMFLLRDGTGIRNMTLGGLSGTLGPSKRLRNKTSTAGAYCSIRSWMGSR